MIKRFLLSTSCIAPLILGGCSGILPRSQHEDPENIREILAASAAYAPPYRPNMWNDLKSAELESFCRRGIKKFDKKTNDVKHATAKIIANLACGGYYPQFVGRMVFEEYNADARYFSKLLPSKVTAIATGYQLNSNCFTYALNQKGLYWGQDPFDGLDRTKLSPAQQATVQQAMQYLPDSFSANDREFTRKVIEGSLEKGLTYIGEVPEFVKGSYLIALFIRPEQVGDTRLDYHYLRQNRDNITWSHKKGIAEVINTDDNGIPIVDPKLANLEGYVFVGYMSANGDHVQSEQTPRVPNGAQGVSAIDRSSRNAYH